MKKKEKEHWALEALNQGCFETGKVVSQCRRWFSGLEWQEAKKTTAGTLDVLSEKAENVVESVKKSLIDIGGSFKSGFITAENASEKPEAVKGKKPVRKGKTTKTTAGTSKAKLKEDLPEKFEKNQRDDEDKSLSAVSRQEISDETAEDDKGGLPTREGRIPKHSLREETSESEPFPVENEDLEKEIEDVTEHLPDIGDARGTR